MPTYEQVFTYGIDAADPTACVAVCRYCQTMYFVSEEMPSRQNGDGCEMCDPQEADYDG